MARARRALLIAGALLAVAPGAAQADISVSGPPLAVEEEGTSTLVFTVRRDPVLFGRTATVRFRTVGGTATPDADHTAVTTTVELPPQLLAPTERTVAVPLLEDALDEDSETVEVLIDEADGDSVGTATATGTILDDGDPPPTVSVRDASQTEGTAVNRTLSVPVELSGPSGRTVTVPYTVTRGTAATDDATFTASGTLTFAPGDESATVTITTVADAVDELDETLTVALGTPTNATVAGGTATATIVDDDTASLTLGDVTAAEGTGPDATPFTVPVSLSTASDRSVTVRVRTAAGGTATLPADAAALDELVTFAPGQTARTATLSVVADALDEPDETVALTLAEPVNGSETAAVADGSGVGTITDDDAAPSVSIADGDGAEGTGTPGSVPLAVTLDAPSGRTVTVDVAVAAVTATGADASLAGGTVTFAPGDVEETFSVATVGDAVDELDETLAVTLATPTNATPGVAAATATIEDDETARASIADVTVVEGTAATTADATLTVSLSTPADRPASVRVATADGTATAPGDYTAADVVVAIPAGTTTATTTVPVVRDAVDELDETLTATISDPTVVVLDDTTATVTVTDDDTAALRLGDVTAAEGTGVDPTGFTVPVSLSTPSDRAVTVRVRTATGGTATRPADAADLDELVTFAPGQTARSATLAVVADALDETDETVSLALASPVNGAGAAAVADGAAVATITDDDAAPIVSVGDATVTEGTGDAPTPVAVRVTLSGPSGRATAVRLTTAGGTATAPSDYASADAVVPFAAGETEKDVVLAVVADAVDEPDETLGVALSAPEQLTIGGAAGTVTVLDDDVAPVEPEQPQTPQPPVTPVAPPAPAAPSGPPTPTTPTTPVTPVTAAGAPDRTRPAIRLTSLALQRPDRLRTTVTCPAAERRCRGSVTVFTVPNRRAGRALLRRELRIARVEFSVAGGSSRTLRPTLTRTARTLLRQAGRLQIRAYGVARDAAGNVGFTNRRTTIRR